jgi:hypothetical protein
MAQSPLGPDKAPDFSNTPGDGRFSRRQFGAGAISLVALGTGLLQLQRAAAEPSGTAATTPVAPAETAAFLAFSQAITGHHDLDATTAGRICAAMLKASAEFAAQLQKLAALGTPATEPKDLLALADTAGLRGIALSIVAAWYTGTVGSGANATVVSYAKALMYQPVSDGMTVPTYCNFGPGWWTVAPPAIRVSAPVAPMPVPPAKTTGTPVPLAH